MPDSITTPTTASATPSVTPSVASPSSPSFVVPEAYAKEPWAAEVKSFDDLWKRTSELQILAGKKGYVAPADNATPEERRAFYSKVLKEVGKVPEKPDGYKFEHKNTGVAPDPEADMFFASLFHKHDIPPDLAASMVGEYETWAGERVKKIVDGMKARDAEYSDLMTKMYGNRLDAVVAAARSSIKEMVPEALRSQFDTMDAKQLAAIVAITDVLHTKYTGEGKFGKIGDTFGSTGVTLAELEQQQLALIKNPGFSNPMHPEYKAIKEKNDALERQIYELRRKK